MAGWSEAGNNLTTTDNVGIGTANPQSTLHANGVLTVSPGSGPDARVLLGSGPDGVSVIKSQVVTGSHLASALTSGSQLTFYTFPIASRVNVGALGGGGGGVAPAPMERLTIDSAGLVGIGTTTPHATLDVNGGASFQGTISLNRQGVFGVGSPKDPRPGITFGATDTSAAFYLGAVDKDAAKETAMLGVFSFVSNEFLQFWAPNGNVGIGTSNPAVKLEVNGTVRVSGDIIASGDVLLSGADCAEEFDINTRLPLEAGTVVVIDEGGALRESSQTYDRKVAGVVSGGGDYRHALLLDKRASGEGRAPIALVGKVFCKVDAEGGAIGIGDLLTTSSRPGHAMKASDPSRAFGAIIGKALGTLSDGVGLVPILVALQ